MTTEPCAVTWQTDDPCPHLWQQWHACVKGVHYSTEHLCACGASR